MDDYNELVGRLKDHASSIMGADTVCKEAAEAIERLSAEFAEINNEFGAEHRMYLQCKAELAALKSASAEPVAYLHRYKYIDGSLVAKVAVGHCPEYNGQHPVSSEPLYLHPAPAAVQEDAKDAARYRWLRDNEGAGGRGWAIPDWYEYFTGELDAAIDAAMKESKE